ncbi:MAG TPA: multiheme c-type cytochrome, partial [Longimicrobiales bacterium]|nr:multiheme c-type cytochrome [Longimicrobiales bacterium]
MGKAEPKKRGAPAVRVRRGPVKWLMAGVVLLIGVAVALLVLRKPEISTLAAFPAAPPPPADSIAFADFVGSERCAECHASEHAAWAASTHGRAGQAPPRDLVLRRFDGAPIRFRDAVVRPRVSGGQYEFVVEWLGRSDRYPIVGVVGAGHMIGGGTQGFLWRHQDGSLRLLPFEIESRDRAWFCSTGTRAERGWVRITPEMSIADCGDWPPVRVFGSTARYASCQECHGSQIEIAGGARPYDTRFATLAINCESCHGAARAHVESGARMEPLAALSRDQSIGVCMSCHALKVDVRRGYLP